MNFYYPSYYEKYKHDGAPKACEACAIVLKKCNTPSIRVLSAPHLLWEP